MPGFEPTPEDLTSLSTWQRRMLLADLLKTGLSDLIAWQPEVLIFDFIDERVNLLEVGAALLACSQELGASGLIRLPQFAGARMIRRDSDECLELWTAAVRRLGRIIKHRLPKTAVVLHRAGWCQQVLAVDGGIKHFHPQRQQQSHDNNLLLQVYNRHFEAAFPRAHVIFPARQHRKAHEGHRWGPRPYHYAPDYYPAVAIELERAIATDPGAPPYRSPG